MTNDDLRESLRRLLEGSPFLIVIPPASPWMKPGLGAHILQAVARTKGVDLQVLYASYAFMAVVGPENLRRIGRISGSLTMERIFARAAHGMPPLGGDAERLRAWLESESSVWQGLFESVLAAEAIAPEFSDVVADAIAESDVKVVGCSTVFEQTNAALAILRRVKERRPDIVTLLGGANCESVMGRALAELTAGYVDYVFSSESERTFAAFIDDFFAGQRPAERVIEGLPEFDLDAIPSPRFDDYFAQVDALVPECRRDAVVSYETSRGCWWGAKKHCTFCGLNAGRMTFRQKSPDRVIADVREILVRTPARHLDMVDNIMPHDYHKTLVPRLAEQRPWGNVEIFYEVKANLTLEQVHNMALAGITCVQPGIEALSTPLLKLMRKGTTGAQNIRLLRYARAEKIEIQWNLLTAFPGDKLEWYAETEALIPLLMHLPAPSGRGEIVIERFSPYFMCPEQFGVSNVRITSYEVAFPPGADLPSLAYHFEADYQCGSHDDPELMARLDTATERWTKAWKQPRIPILHVQELAGGDFVLIDTRPISGNRRVVIDADQARAALVASRSGVSPAQEWAIENKVAVLMDGDLVPLATADYELLSRLESGGMISTNPAVQQQSIPVN